MMPERPSKDTPRGVSILTIMVGCTVIGFIVGTLLFHVTNTSSKLISIEYKLNRIERTLKEQK